MGMAPVGLRCEYMTDPLGVGERRPRLSWRVEDSRRGAVQRGYRILVASTPAQLANDCGDLWDTGMVTSADTAHIVYDGSPLFSRQRCYWKVQCLDLAGVPSAWSAPAWWEMGLLEAEDWHGNWMRYAEDELEMIPRPAVYFRTDLSLRAPAQVRAYVTARGVYELWANGERVGDADFAPGWTDYRQRLNVQVYDLTPLLSSGANALGLVLGEGWYCGRLGWPGNRNFYGDTPEIYCQIEITYADGTREVIGSGPGWQCAHGPILASGFLLGETYDARREEPGWCAPGFAATGWQMPRTSPRDATPFCFAVYPPVRPQQEIAPVSLRRIDADRYLFDLGQNIVGCVRLRVRGDAGTSVTLRYGETVYPDGLLYVENLRSARSTDVYRLRGEGDEVYEPHFTYHGFRYVEVTGLPAPPTADTITGIVLHSDAPMAGKFACSDPQINQLYANIVWSQRGNFLEVPTDCPQRDERLGWMGDGQVFARTACYNMDLAAFYAKWLTDINDAQHPSGIFSHVAPDILPKTDAEARARLFNWDISYHGMAAWGDAGVIMPWICYQFYGDTRLLERCYPHMAAWVDYLERRSVGLISPAEGFGDWLSIDADTPKDVLATAFFAHAADLTARAAAVLGRTDDAARYRALFTRIADAFSRTFVDAEGRITGHTQTGYVLALHFGLLPEARRAQAAAHLAADIRARDTHTTCGFVGISYLQHVLTAHGEVALAYALLEQRSFPAWLYSVEQGATTIWERWDGYHHEKGLQNPGMNSFNHYSLGSVGEWLFSTVGGIALDPARPGFTHAIIRPRPGGALTWADASYDSLPGRLHTRWERNAGTLTLAVTIPPNCTATVYLPTADAAAVQESHLPLAEAPGILSMQTEDGAVRCEVVSGTYRFVMADQMEISTREDMGVSPLPVI